MDAADRGRPTGTVTFLFTDVEGSTQLWESNPKAMQAALARHDAIVREAVHDRDGSVFSTAGDAFSVAFHTPSDAVGAALEAQRRLHGEAWPPGATIRVRMGVHIGTAHERDGDYFGQAVNRTARLMSLAHGGQVLVSLAVEELIRDDLTGGVRLSALGEHRLKGLSRPETVYQLTAQDLPDDFAPLASALPVKGNLPAPSTTFVGRGEEVKRLAAEVVERRVVSLVGPGGVGKTRLAIEAARLLTEAFVDGVWFVELAPVGEPEAVVHAVASALSVTPAAGVDVLDTIVETLAGRRALVIMDNCEHVIGAAARVVAELARGAPSVSILSTSREPLGVGGERVWDVSALDIDVEAVRLFCDRVAAAVRTFEPSETELTLIGTICERLDGMPLALELAAGRVHSMSLAQLGERLADRFRLLRGPTRAGSPERHQTLKATVDWSYRLLTTSEQTLFDRLAVFAGSFDLHSAEVVCGTTPLDPSDVFDLVTSLVDKSLVLLDRDGGRYQLLETLRQFGAEQLDGRDELRTIRDRHLEHFADSAQRARRWFEGSENDRGREWFGREWNNVRSALEHAETTGAWTHANRLVTASHWYAMAGARSEHGRWAESIASSGQADAQTIGSAAHWAWFHGEYDSGHALAHRAVEAAGDPQDPSAAFGWFSLTQVSWYSDRRDEAVTALDAARRAADPTEPFNVLIEAWVHPTVAFSPADAPQLIADARAKVSHLRNATLDGFLAWLSSCADHGVGDFEHELIELREAVRLGAEAKAPLIEAIAVAMLAVRSPGLSGKERGDQYSESISRLHELGIWSLLYLPITALAEWWAELGRLEPAGRIIGALTHLDPGGNNNVADARAHTVALLDAHPDSAAWRTQTTAMSRDDLVVYCLEHL